MDDITGKLLALPVSLLSHPSSHLADIQLQSVGRHRMYPVVVQRLLPLAAQRFWLVFLPNSFSTSEQSDHVPQASHR